MRAGSHMAARFDQPFGSQSERDAGICWGAWWDASPYGAWNGQAYHTGVDGNCNTSGGYCDVNAPCYASADGKVVYVGTASGWQGMLVCIEHLNAGDNGETVWTRYAHLRSPVAVTEGQQVTRGTELGRTMDYSPSGPSGDHAHVDWAWINLGRTGKPGDWPGNDLSRVLRDYIDPEPWIESHRTEEDMACRGAPRVQYQRVVHVVPAGVTDAQLSQVIAVARPTGQTIGTSHDDAGIGDLDSRKAICWGIPSAEQAGIRNFYNQYYPGVVVEFRSFSPPPSSGSVRVTAADGVKSRIGASTNAVAIGTLLFNAVITPIRRDGEWYVYNWGAGGVPAYKQGSTTIGAEAFSMAQYFENV